MSGSTIWPVQPIHNACSVPLSANPGTLPNLAVGISNWFSLVIMEKITKTITNFQVVETTSPVNFQGLVYTLTPRQLMMKPYEQRAWKWKGVYCYPSAILKPDDVLLYEGQQYRVMATYDWKQYGFIEYHIQSDYVGSGPTGGL